MKRRIPHLFILATVFILGQMIAFHLEFFSKLILPTAASLIILGIMSKFFGAKAKDAAILALFLFIGALAMTLQIHSIQGGLIPRIARNDGSARLIGTVSSAVKPGARGVSFELDGEAVIDDGVTYKIRERVRVDLAGELEGIEEGSKLSIEGAPYLPKRRPGSSFDYRSYLLKRRIAAVLSASSERVEMLKTQEDSLARLKKRLLSASVSNIGGEEAAVFNGVLLGERSMISKETKEAFSKAGVSHILAVSGLHVGIIGAIILGILIKLPKAARNLAAIASVGFYVLLVGFQPSLVRAAIMLTLGLGGWLAARETDSLSAISLAAILILAFDPLSIFNVGFQLSFLATLGIILISPNLSEVIQTGRKFLDKSISVTIGAQLMVLPLLIIHFNEVFLLTPISNLIITPLLAPILFAALFASASELMLPFLASLFFAVSGALIHLMLLLVGFFSGLTLMNLTFPKISPLLTLAYYPLLFLGIALLKRKEVRLNKGGLIRLVMIVLIISISFQLVVATTGARGPKVIFFDVGQGDASLIVGESGETILIDGGDSYPLLRENLIERGITRIDLLVMSHPHDDHIGAFPGLVDDYSVGLFIGPDRDFSLKNHDDLIDLLAERGIEVKETERGDEILLSNGLKVSVLSPPKSDYSESLDPNIDSLVIKVSLGETEILFTGDIDEEVEKGMLKLGLDLKSDILKVAHHGSKNSSSYDFLDEVDPKIAVISVGANNSFGHPHREVLSDLKALGVDIFRTDINGDLTISLAGPKIRVEMER